MNIHQWEDRSRRIRAAKRLLSGTQGRELSGAIRRAIADACTDAPETITTVDGIIAEIESGLRYLEQDFAARLDEVRTALKTKRTGDDNG